MRETYWLHMVVMLCSGTIMRGVHYMYTCVITMLMTCMYIQRVDNVLCVQLVVNTSASHWCIDTMTAQCARSLHIGCIQYHCIVLCCTIMCAREYFAYTYLRVPSLTCSLVPAPCSCTRLRCYSMLYSLVVLRSHWYCVTWVQYL